MGQSLQTAEKPLLRLYGATPTEIIEIHIVKNNEVVYRGVCTCNVLHYTERKQFTALLCRARRKHDNCHTY